LKREKSMQFVVKASKPNWIGATGWIAPIGTNRLRAVGEREQAQVFASRDEAVRAIDMLSPYFAASGTQFSIERVDEQSNPQAVGQMVLGTAHG
jgi:hypothetical protein